MSLRFAPPPAHSTRALPRLSALLGVTALFALGACDDGADLDAGPRDAGPPASPAAVFELDGEYGDRESFFDLPWPSDLRLRADGTPDMTGYPNGGSSLVRDVVPVAERRRGYSTVPVAYFRFGAPIATQTEEEVLPAEVDAPVLLLDVDPTSPERGRLFPTVARTFPRDSYTRDNLLGVAAYPGVVLHPNRTYAVVVRAAFGDAGGAPLPVAEAFAQVAAGEAPDAALGAQAVAVYGPLFETLDTIGVPRAEVVTATVFTTGDVVADLYDLTERLRAEVSVTLEGVALDPVDGDHDRTCELLATVSMPQYQVGEPPFDTEGQFELGADGLPIEQRREVANVVLTLPKTEMPAAGYPLMVYFHGSGGVAAQVIDRGPRGGAPTGEGPAHMIAQHGFASAGAALPLSPDRLPGASSIAYLNFANLAAFPFTFTQGVIESRLLIDALEDLRVDPSALGACAGPTLPAGEAAFRFDAAHFVGLGQSMGGMYTNLVGAVEPRLEALVPTGAGGFWPYFILNTSLFAEIRTLLSGPLRLDADLISHLHPSLGILTTAWEPAEPMVFMPRLSRRPLDGIAPRPIYEPVGQGDSFFPTVVYDAMALAYGHPQAGEVVWPTMQTSLAYGGLDGIIDYPVTQNLMSEGGGAYTGVVVQSAGDGVTDPHEIYVQIPEIRRQWGCFLATAIAGDATVVAPAPEGTPCQ